MNQRDPIRHPPVRAHAPAGALAPAFGRPLYPEGRDQGDPYVLPVPKAAGTPFAYYTYVSGGENPAAGRAFPVYGSTDLRHWRYLGESLVADVARAHWAPCVRYIPCLARPYVMLYSRAIGLGEAGHIGHAIRRADSTSPAGPFVDSGHVLTPDLDFAIDPDVYRLRDGSLRLAFAMDFVHDPPLGTGIVETKISEDLTTLEGPLQVLARAQHDWQIYNPKRKLPWKTIPGVNWETDTVVWHTVEAPVGGLVSPRGQDVYLYSGGCFLDFYAIGALARKPSGRLADVSGGSGGSGRGDRHDRDGGQDAQSGQGGHYVLCPQPERGFFAPGHCCWFRDHDGHDYLMFHARYGAPDAPRQMTLAPLRWNAAGLPEAVLVTPA